MKNCHHKRFSVTKLCHHKFFCHYYLIVIYQIFLLCSCKGNFFTKVLDQQTDQPTTRLLKLLGAANKLQIIVHILFRVLMRKHRYLILVFLAKNPLGRARSIVVQNSKVVKNRRYHVSSTSCYLTSRRTLYIYIYVISIFASRKQK